MIYNFAYSIIISYLSYDLDLNEFIYFGKDISLIDDLLS